MLSVNAWYYVSVPITTNIRIYFFKFFFFSWKKKKIQSYNYDSSIIQRGNTKFKRKKKEKKERKKAFIQIIPPHLYTMKFNHTLQLNIFWYSVNNFMYWQLAVSFIPFVGIKQCPFFIIRRHCCFFSTILYFFIPDRRLSKSRIFFSLALKTWNLKISKRWIMTIPSLLISSKFLKMVDCLVNSGSLRF